MAGLVGVLAAAAALAAGHLTAGLTAPRSSPYLVVGDAAVDLTPQPVKSLAIALFGTSDKLALLVGMGVVITLLAVAAGLLSRRGPAVGASVIGVFGLVGVTAALARPTLGATGVVAPVVATLVGVGVFLLLHRAARPPAHERDATGDGPNRTRRRFLASSSGVVVAVGATGITGEMLSSRGRVRASRRAVGPIVPARAAPRIPPDADFARSGTPAFVTPNADFYRIDTALTVPQVPADEWRLRVHGMVDRPLEWTFADLTRRRLVEHTITLTCVSNPVGGNLISTSRFVGVPIREVLREAGVRPGAQQVLSSSAYNAFTAGTPVDALLEPDRNALLAVGMNGEPLPAEHGFPVRMVVPGLYGYVSATKWVTDLELTTWDRQTYWEQRGWATRAPIKPQSRIDRPSSSGRVPAGRMTAAGIAWAQPVGVERVEVRLDRGPWRRAQLAAAVNSHTWRMWRVEFDVPPGGHTLEVRATDRSGRTQTPKRAPVVPDGATGWHSVSFTAD